MLNYTWQGKLAQILERLNRFKWFWLRLNRSSCSLIFWLGQPGYPGSGEENWAGAVCFCGARAGWNSSEDELITSS